MDGFLLKDLFEIIKNLDSVLFIKRDRQIFGRRHLENEISIKNWMEIKGKNTVSVPHNEVYEIGRSIMTSEWMLEVPEDIDDWIAVLCPEGKRCCVIAQDNRTKVVNKFGVTINYFQSLFPYGCHVPNNCPSHRKRTILDCLYNYKLKKYYILDIIEWMGVTYKDFDAEFRFYFIQSKLCEIPGIDQKSEKNLVPFELAPRMIASDLYPRLLEDDQFFDENVDLDGINFYYPNSLYTPGDTPLVLWLKPYMVPDVLGRPVNDNLALKPPDYVNVFEQSQSLKKKNKKNKKKKNGSNSENMEVDNSVEVETDKDSIVENEM